MAKRIQWRRPKLYKKQLQALFALERIVCCEASTKAGKTHGCIVWLFEKAFLTGRPGRNYWWVAPISAQAKIAFNRMKRALPDGTFTANHSELILKLKFNGAEIHFKSADKPDSLFGEDVYAAVVDEASRCKEDSWFAVRSTLTATQGPIRMIGNVKGRKNWFYTLSRRIESGDIKDAAYFKLTAWDAVQAGIFPIEEFESAKSMLPDHIFRELYLAEPTDDGGNPFDIRAIAACVRKEMSTKPVAGWGWDLAKSVDWTVGIGLDEDGDTVEFERFQRGWKDTVRAIRRSTGDTPALVDSTGVGDPVLEYLQELEDGQSAESSNFQGFKFTQASKQQLMEGLAVAIQQGDITFPDGQIRLELEAFEYEYTRTGVRYSAPEGYNDDCVMALALAVRQMREPKPFFFVA